MTCTFPPWCLCLPDHRRSEPFGAGSGHAVGADDGAVQVEVGVSGCCGPLQRGGQAGGVLREHGDPLVQVPVGGGQRYAVVAGELSQSGTIDMPELQRRAAAITARQRDTEQKRGSLQAERADLARGNRLRQGVQHFADRVRAVIDGGHVHSAGPSPALSPARTPAPSGPAGAAWSS